MEQVSGVPLHGYKKKKINKIVQVYVSMKL